MPLDIQIGGFAEKIRRALGVRGRMPLRLDETVVPVIVAGSVFDTPYRLDGSDFKAAVLQPAIAGEFAFAGVQLPADIPGVIVIDGWIITTSTVASTLSMFVGSQASYAATATLAPAQLPVNVEHYPAAGLGVAPNSLPFGQTTRGTDAVLGIGSHSGVVRLLTDTSIYLPWRVTLRPGWAAAWWCRTVNVPCDIAAQGTYYPDAPSS